MKNPKVMWMVLAVVIAAAIIIAGVFLWWRYAKAPVSGSSDAAYAPTLAACGSYPNGSVQNVIETNRLSIELPKNLYPNQDGYLPFTTVSGTAQASWISNAGPAGTAYGSTTDCWAWYYEFDGQGEVDLAATSSVAGVPEYAVRFMVASVYGSSTVEYRNTEYGFTFTLPADWTGFTIVTSTWYGSSNNACPTTGCPKIAGPMILIRNPQWTQASPWQDIPIEIFTHSEWNAIASGTFVTSAAPIPPAELDSNAEYVFALPPRYDYAYPNGWQEVEAIVASKPLHAFAPSASSTASAPPPVSGGVVRGSVLLGPTCPSGQNPPQPQCAPKPYQTSITISKNIQNPSPFETIHSGASGMFSVFLPAGEYVLSAQGGSPYPRCSEQLVKVAVGKTTITTINCDTGIR